MSSNQLTSPADPPRPPKKGGLDLSSRLYATSMLSGPLTDAAPNSVSNQNKIERVVTDKKNNHPNPN